MILEFIKEIRKNCRKGGQWELINRAYRVLIIGLFGTLGVFEAIRGSFPIAVCIFMTFLGLLGAVGTWGGAHRLWSHRSYKAKLPLRIILMIFQTLSHQESIYSWARDHRLHHKFCETDADPHNIKRGVFFSHFGWTLIKEHPEVKRKESQLDLSDLTSDPVVAFQHKVYRPLELFINHVVPIAISYKLWMPSLYLCVTVNFMRLLITLNVAAMGNSVAHSWTKKPYDRSITPADVTWLTILILGEGYHNFHHVFPWDYRSTNTGPYILNMTTMIIDAMYKIGWAYDLKTASDHIVRERARRTGDGSHEEFKKVNGYQDKNYSDIVPGPWGWGDADIPKELLGSTITIP